MRKISVFNFVSIDGFYAGPNGETDWFYAVRQDDEWDTYTHRRAKAGGILMFGRTTYEMMKSFWPTPEAIKSDPRMANVLNNSLKIVFSRTLESAEEGPNWKHIRLLRQINPEEILKLKEKQDIMLLGSGSIVQQLTNLGLIDEYNLVVVPVVLGAGKSFFQDVKKTNLKLLDARPYKNGIVLLKYKRA